MARALHWLLPGVLAMAAVSACSTKVVAPAGDEPPAAVTPSQAVRRLEWGIEHRDLGLVEGLLTDDFQFITAGVDSAGNPDRSPARKGSFLDWLRGLLDSSPALTLQFDRNLVAYPDSRPGKNARWHRQIRTGVVLERSTTITGQWLIFLTRGDSASIPAGLRGRGVKPDSTAWWLDRLEDETL